MSPYKRKSARKLVFTQEMIRDIRNDIQNGKSKRQIARELNIPEATLRKRLKIGTVPESLGRYKCVFPQEMEKQLADYVKEMDRRFYGITHKDLQVFAFEYAEVNGLQHCFNREKKLAGEKWVGNFCRRQNITLRQPEKTSMGRLMGFNRPQVEKFFNNLKTLYEKFNFSPERVYNMDETGLSTVPNKIPKVLSEKGKRLVGKVTSAERGQLVTAVCCMSASGTYVPPALIFARKRFREDLYNAAPVGTLKLISDSGFINTDLFFSWMQHFKQHVQPTSENPVLLIFDNHVSHRSLKVINYCRENNIHLLSIPPHSSHKLQPLDKGFFGPLKNAYSQFCDNWLVQNPGRVITQSEVSSLFRLAYYKVANLEKAAHSFASTGIYPFNDQTFSDEDFAASLVSDRPNPKEPGENSIALQKEENTACASNEEIEKITQPTQENRNEEAGRSSISTNIVIEIFNEEKNAFEVLNPPILEPIQELHVEYTPQTPEKQTEKTPEKNEEKESFISPVELRPFPKQKAPPVRRKNSQKSEILTSTPFKTSLEENEKKQKEPKKKNSAKRKVLEDVGEGEQKKKMAQKRTSSCSKVNVYKKTNKLPENKTNSCNKNEDKENNVDIEDEEVLCPGCGEKYEEPPGEDWIQCYQCQSWWHEACTSYSGGIYICDLCADK